MPEQEEPFSVNSWLSREYDAIYEDGTKPKAIYYTPEASYPIISIDDKDRATYIHTSWGKRVGIHPGADHGKDLKLVPKLGEIEFKLIVSELGEVTVMISLNKSADWIYLSHDQSNMGVASLDTGKIEKTFTVKLPQKWIDEIENALRD